jgi:membrane-bound lytic murein transglycosylase B
LGFAGWTAIAADFDGDGKVDPAIYRAGDGSWIVLMSRANYAIAILDPNFLGSTGYTGMAADFDADGYADPTVAEVSTGNWKIKLSSGNYSLVELPAFLGE